MFAVLQKVIGPAASSPKRLWVAGLLDGNTATAPAHLDNNMASRQPSIYALFIINKAGGLIYQKNYAGSRDAPLQFARILADDALLALLQKA